MTILIELTPRFCTAVEELIELCSDQGFRIVPYQGYRSPAAQAKLWRQSRTRAQIEAQIHKFRRAGAGRAAEILEVVGPQHGPHVTNALPFQSWHQFRTAVDCCIESPSSGRTLWRGRGLDKEEFGLATQLYGKLGRVAETLSLTWGGRWLIGDFGHLQRSRLASPIDAYGSWESLIEHAEAVETKHQGSPSGESQCLGSVNRS